MSVFDWTERFGFPHDSIWPMQAKSSVLEKAQTASRATPEVPSRRRRLSKEARFEEILVAAEQVFCEAGFEAATVAEIARRAGVVEGNVYRYVKSKRELLAHVISEWYSRKNDELEKEFAQIASVQSRLRYLIAAHLRNMRDSPALLRLILREGRANDAEFREIVGKLNQRYTGYLRSTIEAGVQNGEFRPQTPVRLVRDMIFGGIEHHSTRFLMGEGHLDVESIADQLLQLVLLGVRAEVLMPPKRKAIPPSK
ncbi:MAG: TetR/AcrR family transcriptional regulator [Comamonadaceae bacterium]|nr:TetR/AcrR family transcriptional regulator [Comamonadaceae bacterium]